MELTDRTAVITGASGALGRALAVALGRAGVDCVCHYHENKDGAQGVAERIEGLGRSAVTVGGDLTKAEEVNRLFSVAEEIGVPTILINSAAVFCRGALGDITLENARGVLDMNLLAPLLVCQGFAEVLKKHFPDTKDHVGGIVNVCDVGAIRPWANYSLYCASKAGLVAATKSLAKELAPAVSVNAVAPGVITWPSDFSDEEKKRQLAFIPARRTGTVEEVAAAVIFLLKSDYITGSVLAVDGGRSM